MTGEAKANVSKAKDIAMHVAAMDPNYLDASEVTTTDLEREKEISRNKEASMWRKNLLK